MTTRVCRGNTEGVKVAVSIPDPIFEEAERASRRMRVPRSQFYARALQAYVKEHSGAEITRRLNELYRRIPSRLEAATEAVALEVLRREKW